MTSITTYFDDILAVEFQTLVQIAVLDYVRVADDGIHHAINDQRDDDEFPAISHDRPHVVVHFVADAFHQFGQVNFGPAQFDFFSGLSPNTNF